MPFLILFIKNGPHSGYVEAACVLALTLSAFLQQISEFSLVFDFRNTFTWVSIIQLHG